MTTLFEVIQTLAQISFNKDEDCFRDRTSAFYCLANNTALRENSDVFIYYFDNGTTTVSSNNYSNMDAIGKVKAGIYKAYSKLIRDGSDYDHESYGTIIKNGIIWKWWRVQCQICIVSPKNKQYV